MRFFNTTGPVRSDKHYCVPPLTRLDLDDVLGLVRNEQYFVLHAPRQTGKTSALLALRDLLNSGTAGTYRCVYANVEGAQAAREDKEEALRAILDELASRALATLGDGFLDERWPAILAKSGPNGALRAALTGWAEADPNPLVLLLDEIDTLVGDTLLSVLRQLRAGYDRRPGGFPQSVVLCGLRDVADYRIDSPSGKPALTGGSPFNIKAKSLRLGDFSRAETLALLAQHTEETGQAFTPDALDSVWTQTQGQPWLVNALAAETCFATAAGRNRARPVVAAAVLESRERLIQRRATHLDYLTDRLEEERVRRVVEPILSGATESDHTARDVEYVRDLGLVALDAPLRMANPIYAEVVTTMCSTTTAPPQTAAKSPCGESDVMLDREARERNREVEELLESVLIDAYGDGEQLWALRQAFEDNLDLPGDAFVIGEPVSIVAFDFDGNERRGLTAKCRRDDGSEHEVSAADVVFPRDSPAALHLAAYRRWLGLPPFSAAAGQRRAYKAKPQDPDLGGDDVALVVLSVRDRTARCRVLADGREVTLRAPGLWGIVPGQIASVTPHKQWRFGTHPYLSGEIASARIDASSLCLEHLRLESYGEWDPAEEYWGEEDDPVPAWALRVIAGGCRPLFEMEQVLPGDDPDDDWDPIIESNELREAGDGAAARKILMDLCQCDLRCLDAHAHLGNAVFDGSPEIALRHYEVGVRIGELSLDDAFDGVLSWGLIDNRPFLRCLHGYGLCLWRLNRRDEAADVFRRMLWLNPADNQGIRFLAHRLETGESWQP